MAWHSSSSTKARGMWWRGRSKGKLYPWPGLKVRGQHCCESLSLMRCSPGMALCPWNVLAAGRIRTDEEEERRRQTGEKGRRAYGEEWERTERERTVCKGLEQVAQEVGATSITAGESIYPRVNVCDSNDDRQWQLRTSCIKHHTCFRSSVAVRLSTSMLTSRRWTLRWPPSTSSLSRASARLISGSPPRFAWVVPFCSVGLAGWWSSRVLETGCPGLCPQLLSLTDNHLRQLFSRRLERSFRWRVWCASP